MTNRRTISDVINPGYNPTLNNPNVYPNTFQNQQNSFVFNENRGTLSGDTRPAAQLRAQNERLKAMIATWKDKKPVIQEQFVSEGGVPEEFNKRIAYNDEKIRDLSAQVRQQEEVIKAYQTKFTQFEDNLNKLMRLDKDIHSKLVNPENSTTLQKNVKNVMIALNSGASYGDVIKMIDSIKV